MAKTFTVTTKQLRSKAEELKSENKKLKSYISQLQQTESSLNTMWDGEANDAFHSAFTKDVTQMQNFAALIETFAAQLNTEAEKYEKAEKTNLATATSRTYR